MIEAIEAQVGQMTIKKLFKEHKSKDLDKENKKQSQMEIDALDSQIEELEEYKEFIQGL